MKNQLPILLLLLISLTAWSAYGQNEESFNEAVNRYTQLTREGKYQEALPFATKAIELGGKLFAGDDLMTAKLYHNHGTVAALAGESRASQKSLQRAIRLYSKAGREGAEGILDVYAFVISRENRTAEKWEHLNEGIKAIRKIVGDSSIESASYVLVLINVASADYDLLPERSVLEDAYGVLQDQLDSSAMELGQSAYYLAAAYFVSQGRDKPDYAKVEAHSKKALQVFESQVELPTEWLRKTLDMRAHLFWYLQDHDRFLESCRGKAAYQRMDETRDYFPILRVDPTLSTRRHGWAVVEMDVDAQGIPQNVRIVEESGPSFGEASAEAVKQWRYVPRCDENGLTTTAGVKAQLMFGSRR